MFSLSLPVLGHVLSHFLSLISLSLDSILLFLSSLILFQVYNFHLVLFYYFFFFAGIISLLRFLFIEVMFCFHSPSLVRIFAFIFLSIPTSSSSHGWIYLIFFPLENVFHFLVSKVRY